MATCGIDTEVVELPEDISLGDFIARLAETNEDPETHGILVFRPLPPQLDENVIKHIIAPQKDVDCLSPSIWRRCLKAMKADSSLHACSGDGNTEVLRCVREREECHPIGRSKVVGKPVLMLLIGESATVTCVPYLHKRRGGHVREC